jgi:hypothetical protein
MYSAVGHFMRYRTHTLSLGDKAVESSLWQSLWKIIRTQEIEGRTACGCDDDPEGWRTQISTRVDEWTKAARAQVQTGDRALTREWNLPFPFDVRLQLKPVEAGVSPQTPYLMVHAGADVIDGHNDIFNERFISFLLSYMTAIEFQADRTEQVAHP